MDGETPVAPETDSIVLNDAPVNLSIGGASQNGAWLSRLIEDFHGRLVVAKMLEIGVAWAL